MLLAAYGSALALGASSPSLPVKLAIVSIISSNDAGLITIA
ncbi:hypothetical protein BVRB_2g031120 [Beta vulgaris subsp. vulgaris]|nr:hypothetical protein BVRB_2g031120 [Beta vulgaris subsp. vulgaris]